MRKLYTDLNIRFTVEQMDFFALNLVFERFLRTIPNHSHGSNSYEIHYIPSGYGHVKINQVLYDIVPNTLYITGPHVEHAQVPSLEDPMCEYCVYLKIRDTFRSRKPSPVMDAFLSMPFWIGLDTQGVHPLMRQLFSELEHRYTGYQNQVELLLPQLLICMVRNYEQHRLSSTVFAHNMSDSKSVIIDQYFLYEYHSLSLEVLADRLKVSPRQTQRLLQEYYGKTFQQKKAEARMSAAAILLSDRERSISSIAEALGYSSAEHFSSAFRNYYKISPGRYRRQNVP